MINQRYLYHDFLMLIPPAAEGLDVRAELAQVQYCTKGLEELRAELEELRAELAEVRESRLRLLEMPRVSLKERRVFTRCVYIYKYCMFLIH